LNFGIRAYFDRAIAFFEPPDDACVLGCAGGRRGLTVRRPGQHDRQRIGGAAGRRRGEEMFE